MAIPFAIKRRPTDGLRQFIEKCVAIETRVAPPTKFKSTIQHLFKATHAAARQPSASRRTQTCLVTRIRLLKHAARLLAVGAVLVKC